MQLRPFVRLNVRHLTALLLAAFWFAQVQGVVHEIGHLAAATQAHESLAAPHAAFCSECLALAQAGAAPVSSPPAAHLSTAINGPVASTASVAVEAVSLAYRSRAPPSSSI